VPFQPVSQAFDLWLSRQHRSRGSSDPAADRVSYLHRHTEATLNVVIKSKDCEAAVEHLKPDEQYPYKRHRLRPTGGGGEGPIVASLAYRVERLPCSEIAQRQSCHSGSGGGFGSRVEDVLEVSPETDTSSDRCLSVSSVHLQAVA
jgi:hypothetical protein